MKKRVKVEVEEQDSQQSEESQVVSESVENNQNQHVQGESVDQLELLRKESAENYDKYLRAMADIDNLKKRVAKERSDLLRYAGENLARDLLDVVENLRRATNQESSDSAVTEYRKGVALILEEFLTILGKHGITTESAIGQQFDPTKHDALASQPSEDHEEGVVIDELKQAYFFKDKLLRPAQVVVSVKSN